ncbi:hypothetical protein ACHAPI_007613 [Fusarium lateritium]
MHISKQIITILAFPVLSVSAAPAERKVMAKPGKMAAAASITYCANTRWNGECRTVGVPLDECHSKTMSQVDGTTVSVLSVTIPKIHTPADGISIVLVGALTDSTRDWNCNGKSYGNQVDANLADGNGEFNDSISSYSCRTK